MEVRHIKGSTWALTGNLTIPVYRLNHREVVLLDTGYAKRNRADIDSFLTEENLRVAAVIGSHGHNDHVGNLAYYQEKDDAEIILPFSEAAALSAPYLLKTLYGPASLAQLRQELTPLLARAERTFTTTETEITVCGVTFGLLHLPGHTPGHTGIATPDGILYVGDAVVDEAVLERAKLPSTMSWRDDLVSKERLKSMVYDGYLLAHNGFHADISALIDANIADKHRRGAEVLALLKEPVTISELEGLAWQAMGMTSTAAMSVIIFRRNLQCAVDHLADIGAARILFDEGMTRYVRA